jgi:hypothetical protein
VPEALVVSRVELVLADDLDILIVGESGTNSNRPNAGGATGPAGGATGNYRRCDLSWKP